MRRAGICGLRMFRLRKARVSNPYGRGNKAKATKLHSLLVRKRGACERCGSRSNLQCAHIIGRRYSATRTDEMNAWCLCAKCHLRLTEHPDEHMAFVYVTIGEDQFRVLKDKALSNLKPWTQAMWGDEAARLQQLIDDWED